MGKAKVEKVKRLVIDRNTWLRGEGSEDSYLLRSEDKKMCCLGFYLNQCGVPRKQLVGNQDPHQVKNFAPKQAGWLMEDGYRESTDAEELIRINDARSCPRRESKIARIFAKHNVNVVFKG